MSTAVLALGGNALARADEPATITNQFRHARESMAAVVPLAREGWRIVIVHGNGPQVGDSLVRNEVARRVVEPLPLGVLVAETAGWIGYMLQQSLQNALAGARVSRQVVTVVTQTLVDRFDPALSAPTKPIGQALTDDEAGRLREAGRAVGRDGAGAWRTDDDQPAAARGRGVPGDPRPPGPGCHRDRRGRRGPAGVRRPHPRASRAWTRWSTRIGSRRCSRGSSRPTCC